MKTYEYGGFNSDLEKDLNDLYSRATNITEDNVASMDDALFSINNVKFSDVSTVNSTPMLWVNKLLQFFKINRLEHLYKLYTTDAFTVGKGIVGENIESSDNARTKIVFQTPEGYDGRQAMLEFNMSLYGGIDMPFIISNKLLEDNCRGGMVITYNKSDITVEFIHESCKYDVPAAEWKIHYWRSV